MTYIIFLKIVVFINHHYIYINNFMKEMCITNMYLSKRNSNVLIGFGALVLLLINRGVCGYCYIITNIN